MLDSTMIVVMSEFGRTPIMQGSNGRDHHPYGFSAWMAGGGINGGKVIGAIGCSGGTGDRGAVTCKVGVDRIK